MSWKVVVKHSPIEPSSMNANLAQAQAGLSSENSTERFQAAIYFTKNSHPELRQELAACLHVERVRHIKMALSKALHYLTPSISSSQREGDTTNENENANANAEQFKLHLKSQIIDEFSGVILHELAPRIGLIESALQSEFTEYETSNAKKHVKRLSQIFQAIESLKKSTNKPERKETDLYQLLRDLVSDEMANYSESNINVSWVGIQPCVIYSDPALLSLTLSNAIRNSIESLLLTKDSESNIRSLVITWGTSDIDTWVSVIDNGIGVQGNPEEAFKIGNTNKDGHTGFGMGIMKQAMDSLGGNANLSNLSSGGAQLLLRWGNF